VAGVPEVTSAGRGWCPRLLRAASVGGAVALLEHLDAPAETPANLT
jgi:hypothetical protein